MIIDRLGGVEAPLEGREEFHEAVLRMNRERGALIWMRRLRPARA